MSLKRLRILHAPAVVINQQWIISRAQRKLGHISDFMVFKAEGKDLPTTNCDINFDFDRKNISLKLREILPTLKFFIRFAIFFIKALFRYDIFHFHSESFFGSHSALDLKILKIFRKKIIFQYWGCDVRLKTMSMLSEERSTCEDCIRVCQNSRKMRDNFTQLRYADFRVYGGADVIRMVPDAIFIPIAVDLDFWNPADLIPKEYRLPEAKGVRILQAFENANSRGDQKGTRFIKQAVENLKKEGLEVNYTFLDEVPYHHMRYYYQQADIVVDQLLTGWHGSVTMEALAMGKPVICYLSKDALKLLPRDNPIVNANIHNITDKLRMLVRDKALREEIGKKSREYVKERHDALKLAKLYIDLYQKNWR